MGDGVDATSFEFYEGIRIIIPGVATVGLAELVVRTVSVDGKGLGLDTFPAVIISLLVGLVFYFIDAPAKATTYRHDLPTQTLREFGRAKPGTWEVNNYFVILDDDMPSGIKARALYMGSMFRIGYEITVLLVGASLVMLSQPLWSTTAIDFDWRDFPHTAWVALAGLVSVWVFAAYAHRVNNRRRVVEKRPTTQAVHGDRLRDVGIGAFPVAVLIAIAVASRWLDIPRWSLLVPAGMELLHWLYRYSKGYPQDSQDRSWRRVRRFWLAVRANRRFPPADPPRRRPASALEATRLVALASALLVLTYFWVPAYSGWLNRWELKVWIAALLIGAILVVARGHEKRLAGAYATQRTWLILHQEEITEKYCEMPDEPGLQNLGGTSLGP